ncbi:TetR/AcrR family transcriptional regulator [Streptomyces orinoci]|uniref:TetR/AcrR family transcriptional regulator n=1 Tax=Streptomyces orinoci TaxID=67339 RepID=A0ABV3JYF1_STRON|nr:TetR/AcrR family transcriptional regulator [Streptomyces orinoci]
MSAPPQPRLRADAQRNRERILVAARELLVEEGPEFSFDKIARRVGVGNATLYRHFADRRELIHHVVLSVVSRIADRAERARAEEPDAFRALSRFVHAAADEQVGALCPLLDGDVDRHHPELEDARLRMERGIEALLSAARNSGQLRPDVEVGDLMMALSQLTRPLPGPGCTNFGQFIHRHLQIFLDGLLAPARSQLPGRAATFSDFRDN